MTTQKKGMEVVKDLDLERYMGRWYEIASFPSIFQPKNGVDPRATYPLNPDGTVHVLNETWNGGKRAFIQGSAYKTDPKSDEAKFKVKFYVPPFLPIIPVTGDYWVLYIDPDYQHAVIGQPSRSYLWILSRTAHVEKTAEQEARISEEAKVFGTVAHVHPAPDDTKGIWWFKSMFGK
ncbi:PREDICTED: outer membrane lipoprotein Blc-like [Brassica oleracea var. oleracea]|uniref:Lipocalin/cytosolic fatty-acid binding domain-containing protein n=1 Tax=Brassica oleracea var. oleracea TaxID=109376 RepID=A0A0D3ALB2_BRAOL|nr:PREDICTED: outer membrane lipoprotein Blc-like [Brassica oleracea var. oleracea]